jgi:hypothetical protein
MSVSPSADIAGTLKVGETLSEATCSANGISMNLTRANQSNRLTYLGQSPPIVKEAKEQQLIRTYSPIGSSPSKVVGTLRVP